MYFQVKQSVQGILQSPAATETAQLEGLHGTWDGEARIISKLVNIFLFLTSFENIKTNQLTA